MGLFASKAAHGATTDEFMEPDPKHLADLLYYVNETNRTVKYLTDILYEKTGSSSWVVVFKGLVTVHHLMVHGKERFLEHLASRSVLFTLYDFLDNSATEGHTMSTFIRRYSRYLNEKSVAYRGIATDITKIKRGMDGMMRTLNTRDLLNTLSLIQIQFDALLKCNANPEDLTNGIIRAAFMLLFKDSLRLFAVYNEGILNLLDKFFDMERNQCSESLDMYVRFLGRKTKLAEFLKVAEQVGIDKEKIPYLTEAPPSFLEALHQHLDSLEKKTDILSPYSLHHSLIPFSSNRPSAKFPSSQTQFSVQEPVEAGQHGETTTRRNMDDSYVSIIENFKFEDIIVNRPDMKYRQSSGIKITGTRNYPLNTTSPSALWNPITVSSISHMVPSSPVDHSVTSQQISTMFQIPATVGAPFPMILESMTYTQSSLGSSSPLAFQKK